MAGSARSVADGLLLAWRVLSGGREVVSNAAAPGRGDPPPVGPAREAKLRRILAAVRPGEVVSGKRLAARLGDRSGTFRELLSLLVRRGDLERRKKCDGCAESGYALPGGGQSKGPDKTAGKTPFPGPGAGR